MPTRTQNSCCGPSLILSLSWKLKQAKRFSCPYVSKLGFYDIVKTVETAEPRVCYASQEPLVLGLGTNRTEPNTVSMDGPAISVTRKAELFSLGLSADTSTSEAVSQPFGSWNFLKELQAGEWSYINFLTEEGVTCSVPHQVIGLWEAVLSRDESDGTWI